MKKARRWICLILIFVLISGSFSSGAASFDDLDMRSADAGSSAALAKFYASHERAGDQIAAALTPMISVAGSQGIVAGAELSVTGHEIVYQEPLLGIVCTETMLNIRESMTTLSKVAAQVFRGGEVFVVGEQVVNGVLWYKVRVNDQKGCAIASYIRFGDDAANYLENWALQYSSEDGLPEALKISDPLATLPEDVQHDLETYSKEATFVLKNDYPTALAEGDATSRYAILVYLLELYQHVSEVCEEYGLNNTYIETSRGLSLIEHARTELSEETGKTEADFQQDIMEAQNKAKAEKQYQTGVNMANKAAEYIGILPYVWGGASLAYGADCSGFVSQIYAMYGLLDAGTASAHGYDSRALRGVGHEISVSEIQPGDLVCYNGHVAIYYDNGMVVHAPSPGHMVAFGSLYMMPIITVRRLY